MYGWAVMLKSDEGKLGTCDGSQYPQASKDLSHWLSLNSWHMAAILLWIHPLVPGHLFSL